MDTRGSLSGYEFAESAFSVSWSFPVVPCLPPLVCDGPLSTMKEVVNTVHGVATQAERPCITLPLSDLIALLPDGAGLSWPGSSVVADADDESRK